MKKYIISSFLAVIFSATVCSAEPCDKLFSAVRANYACLIPTLFDADELRECHVRSLWSPLHEAAYFGSLETASRLIPLMLSNGFDIEATDGNGYTALSIARSRGDGAMMKLLFANGARK